MEVFEAGSAVIGCAGAAYKLVTAILEIAREAPTIGDQMRKDALPLRAFSDLIETAQYSIKFRLPHVNSAVLSYMRDREVLDSINTEASELLGDINLQGRKIEKLRSNFVEKGNSALRFYATYRWKNTRSPKLELLQPRMEQLKSTLQLIIAVIQLEVLSQNGGASRDSSRLEEIAELRKLIAKHIEAIGQLRESFSGQRGMNEDNDAATGICYLAYTMARDGRVPGREPPSQFDFDRLKNRPITDVDPLRWNPPVSNWRPGTPVCPHCYRTAGTTSGNNLDSGTRTTNRNPSGREVSPGRSSLHRERGLPALPPPQSQLAQQQAPAVRPPKQEVEIVVPVSDNTRSANGDPQPRRVVAEPRPQPVTEIAPQPGPEPTRPEPVNPDIIINPAPSQDVLPEHPPEPQPGPSSNGAPTSSHPPPSSLNNLYPSNPLLPSHSRSPSPDPESDYDLEQVPSQNSIALDSSERQPSRRRRGAKPLPVILTDVEILDHHGRWHSMPVRLDTSLYVPNRHDKKGREIHYYGIISLGTLIDKLGWPEETLLEDPEFVQIPKGRKPKFTWDMERLEGIGRVILTWRVDQSDDEWANAVVPKMTRECIVTRQDPCEQGVVLKAMPAAQGTQS
ncbi:hypothetical protein B0T20DRAFT_114940 [Sordaria brevicollis]|uniref:Uncharacterized protein n=1 Tax=Sordaria brevicollis TaxID=83679 RepID=A0AAE0PKB8_SORBR|nr:hypothetical protein B0T20DRAFT_114940 [Sordaria brevicollis]